MKNNKAFTLVELIVVVTILAILSTIGFVSYSGYLAGVRDTNRIAQLKAIGDALHLYSTNKSLPTPDDKIDIKINTKIISYQGYVGKDTIETIGYTAEGLDPKDNTYFSYYLTKDKKYFQLMAYLEEEQGITSKLKINTKVNAEIDYETRYPRVEGAKLGILTGTGGVPIQELITGEIDLVTQSTGVTSILSNSETQTGTTLQGIASDSSCKRLYEVGGRRINGLYNIDPEGNGTGFKVYCDMETDGGGWTLVHKTTSGTNDLTGDLTTDEGISDWNGNEEYRLSINNWKSLSTEKIMAKNVRIDGLEWNDITEGIINDISINGVDFSQDDIYRLFNRGTLGAQQDARSGTNYWNYGGCDRCMNYDSLYTYGSPDNAPMINKDYTSIIISPIEGAGGTSDINRHRMKKIGIFIK